MQNVIEVKSLHIFGENINIIQSTSLGKFYRVINFDKDGNIKFYKFLYS